MQALIYTTYGSPDGLRLQEHALPTPNDDQVLIRIHAASVNAGDRHLLWGEPFMVRLMSGLRRPKYSILGSDVAGRVAAVGRNITQFQPGDAVFGDLSDSGFGAFAEYVAAPAQALVAKPAALSFAQAAAVPSAALTALQGLRDVGGLGAGQKVLINGAAGGVGTFAVQIAKALGAEVTGVCSTRNVELVRNLGADHVIDYTRADVLQSGARYDLVLDAAAYRSFWEYRRVLTPRGVYVLVGGSGRNLLQVMTLGRLRSRRDGQQFRTFLKQATSERLAAINALLEAGKVMPLIDRCYPLPAAAEALRYFEAGHGGGKILLTMQEGE
ncbi:MAG: NAD(P)-dependent alcohol dehydrogenase [Oscillochloris sp.]|nr:NAD(P)-dependent alcohol dehydrogenase [Oscillochloris sp.]